MYVNTCPNNNQRISRAELAPQGDPLDVAQHGGVTYFFCKSTQYANYRHNSMPLQRIGLRPCRAFTLIELIIAIALLAIISILAITAMRVLISAQQQQSELLHALKELQMTHALFKRDLEQGINRPIRLADKTLLAGFIGAAHQGRYALSNEYGQLIFELTRSGYPNPGGKQARSTLQRVAYYYRGASLIRVVWPFLDRAEEAEAIEQVMLTNIASMRLAYYDQYGGIQDSWLTTYPEQTVSNENNFLQQSAMPVAVEIQFEQKLFGELQWYFLLPGGRRRASS